MGINNTRLRIILPLLLLLSSCGSPQRAGISGLDPDASESPSASPTTAQDQGETWIPAITNTTEPSVAPTITVPSGQPAPTGMIVFACQLTRISAQNQLCLIQADGTGWRQLTDDLTSDHFFPSFSPDNQSVVFSSNQSGEYQIYEMGLASGRQIRLTDSGGAFAPAVSPDGSKIVYTYDPGTTLSDSQLWLMQRDGSNRYPLTSMPGGAWDASWSPDGEYIMFASQVDGIVQLFIMGANGAGTRQVTDLTGLRGRNDWSSQGLLATYIGTTWQREIIIFDLQGYNVTYLTDGGNNLAPSFSPDGEWIAYTSYQDNYKDDHGCEIYIMRSDGSDIHRLTDNEYCDWQPRWSK